MKVTVTAPPRGRRVFGTRGEGIVAQVAPLTGKMLSERTKMHGAHSHSAKGAKICWGCPTTELKTPKTDAFLVCKVEGRRYLQSRRAEVISTTYSILLRSSSTSNRKAPRAPSESRIGGLKHDSLTQLCKPLIGANGLGSFASKIHWRSISLISSSS